MGDTLGVALLAVLTLAVAAYAHARLGALSASAAQLWITRLVLLGIGIGFGWAMVSVYRPVEGPLRVLMFLASFGVVHVPAAAVVWLKRRQRAQL